MLKCWLQTGFLNTPPSVIGQDKHSPAPNTHQWSSKCCWSGLQQTEQCFDSATFTLFGEINLQMTDLQLSNTLIWYRRRYFKIQHTLSFVKALSVRVYQRHQANINRQDYLIIFVNSKAHLQLLKVLEDHKEAHCSLHRAIHSAIQIVGVIAFIDLMHTHTNTHWLPSSEPWPRSGTNLRGLLTTSPLIIHYAPTHGPHEGVRVCVCVWVVIVVTGQFKQIQAMTS